MWCVAPAALQSFAALLTERPTHAMSLNSWSAVGLRRPVELHYVANSADVSRATPVPVVATGPAESRPGLVADVLAWLRERLSERAFRSAILFGSVVRPASMTRFSDIDVTILALPPDAIANWINIIRAWREEVPALRVHLDHADGLERRAPMVAARLLSEGVLVAGREPSEVIRRPRRRELRRDAATWGWQAAPVLSNHLTEPGIDERDVVEVAYLAQKHIVAACRYHHLVHGGSETEADAVVEVNLTRVVPREWLADAASAIMTAREMKPVPPQGEGANTLHLRAAISAVEAIARAFR